MKKYYVVWKGLEIGVFDTWQECQKNVIGVDGALFKSFVSKEDAMRAFEDGYDKYKKNSVVTSYNSKPIPNALTVDAACSGNPGIMEYRGVVLGTREEIFRVGPFFDSSNNIGEFLAIVHGLAFCKQNNLNIPIYSDSMTGISWVKKRTCKTLIKKTDRNSNLFDLVKRAENWLKENSYSNHIYKWDTSSWGEIPADFGRKK